MRLPIVVALLLLIGGCSQNVAPAIQSSISGDGFSLSAEGVRAGASAVEVTKQPSNISGQSYKYSMGPKNERFDATVIIVAGEIENGLVPVVVNLELEVEGTAAEMESALEQLKQQARFKNMKVCRA